MGDFHLGAGNVGFIDERLDFGDEDGFHAGDIVVVALDPGHDSDDGLRSVP